MTHSITFLSAQTYPHLHYLSLFKVQELYDLVNGAVPLRHSNIVGLIAISARIDTDIVTLEIASEFVGGQILQQIINQAALDEARTALYAAGLIEGLHFLHDQDIVHGDFTSAAVVIDALVRECSILPSLFILSIYSHSM